MSGKRAVGKALEIGAHLGSIVGGGVALVGFTQDQIKKGSSQNNDDKKSNSQNNDDKKGSIDNKSEKKK